MFFDQIAGSLIVKLIMPPRAAASSTSWSIVAEVTYSSFSKTDPLFEGHAPELVGDQIEQFAGIGSGDETSFVLVEADCDIALAGITVRRRKLHRLRELRQHQQRPESSTRRRPYVNGT